MAVTLKMLLKNAETKYGMCLIAGDESINRAVTWVHMLEDPQTATFLHGGELIFTTGIGHADTGWLLGFVKDLFERNACGIVINIGPYIKQVPDEVEEFCIKQKFPLFAIPWTTRIVDITHDFCSHIIKSEEEAISAASAFKTAIFCPGESELYIPPLERNGFDLNADFLVVAAKPVKSGAGFESFENKTVRLFQLRLTPFTRRFAMFSHDDVLIIVLQSIDRERLKELLSTVSIENQEIVIAMSSAGHGVDTLPRLYGKVRAALSLAAKRREGFVSYDDLGMFKVFLEIENKEELREVYEQKLGSLENYDKQSGSNLMHLLRLYIEHNAGVQEVAGILNVHRNTVNYKLKKIREILNCELSYTDCMELMMAFYIKEIL